MTNQKNEQTTNYMYYIVDNTRVKENPGWDVVIFEDNLKSRLAWVFSNFEINDDGLKLYWIEKESIYALDSREQAIAAVEDMKLSKILSNMDDIKSVSLLPSDDTPTDISRNGCTSNNGVPLPDSNTDESVYGPLQIPSPIWATYPIHGSSGSENTIQTEVDPVTGIVYNFLQSGKDQSIGPSENHLVQHINSVVGLVSIGGLYVSSNQAILHYIDEKDSEDFPELKVGHYYIARNITEQLADIYTLDNELISTLATGRFEAVTCKQLLETYTEVALKHPHLFSYGSPSSTHKEVYKIAVGPNEKLANHGVERKKLFNNPYSRISLEDRDWIKHCLHDHQWVFVEEGPSIESRLEKLLDSEESGWNEVERLSVALSEAQRENEIIRKLAEDNELGEALTELHEFYRQRYNAKHNECLELLAASQEQLEQMKRHYEQLISAHSNAVPLDFPDSSMKADTLLEAVKMERQHLASRNYLLNRAVNNLNDILIFPFAEPNADTRSILRSVESAINFINSAQGEGTFAEDQLKPHSTYEGGECTCVDCGGTDSGTWVCKKCQNKRDRRNR
ncbi:MULTISPECIES: hypothetical protein [unclassified Paenibacillus]|uniref:hypothetical protein n=1 Tax=unclassified Paenibacillus TaxID=185978 RepID=UPI0030F8CE6E